MTSENSQVIYFAAVDHPTWIGSGRYHVGYYGLERSVSGVVAWLNTISCFDRFAMKTI